jgi:heptosyltransferase II
MSTPLLVRLPNHLGDTLMTLPALDRLATAGWRLTLIGKGWARPLFEAYDWPVHPVPSTFAAALAQWRALRVQAGTDRALLFTNSFGTALGARLGGAAPTGFATDGRRWLLSNAVPVPPRWSRDQHTVEYYDALADALLGTPARSVPPLALRLAPRAAAAAQALLAKAGIGAPYVVLCPGATGRHRGRDKTWSEFARLTGWLLQRHERVVALPGPGERARFESVLPGATILPETDVATFGAILAAGRLVVANDSGPGHLAAAVGARLVSLFGVTEVKKTRPWGRHVTIVGSQAGWPAFGQVREVVERELARPAPA